MKHTIGTNKVYRRSYCERVRHIVTNITQAASDGFVTINSNVSPRTFKSYDSLPVWGTLAMCTAKHGWLMGIAHGWQLHSTWTGQSFRHSYSTSCGILPSKSTTTKVAASTNPGGKLMKDCDRETIRAVHAMYFAKAYWPMDLVQPFVRENW